jgi:hypothetical protein
MFPNPPETLFSLWVASFASWAQSSGKRSHRLIAVMGAHSRHSRLYAQPLGKRSHYRMSVHARNM